MKKIIRLTESDLSRIVRRVINEQILTSTWIDTTTALQGIADYYNNALNLTVYKKYPDKPKIYFSVERTHIINAQGINDVAWLPRFGKTVLSMDKLPTWYIIDQTNLVAKPDIAKKVNQYIATPISQKYNSIKGTNTMNIIAAVDTAVVAINAAIKKDKNTPRPK
jgi:hypothetical protein